MGWITNPRKAAYNRVYNRTSVSVDRIFSRRRRASSGGDAAILLVLFFPVILIFKVVAFVFSSIFGAAAQIQNTNLSGVSAIGSDEGGSTKNKPQGNEVSMSESGNRSTQVRIIVDLSDDGTVTFLDSNRNRVPESWVKKLREQNGEGLRQALEKACQEKNTLLHSVISTHHETPDPASKIVYEQNVFLPEKPVHRERSIKPFSRN